MLGTNVVQFGTSEYAWHLVGRGPFECSPAPVVHPRAQLMRGGNAGWWCVAVQLLGASGQALWWWPWWW